MPPSGYTQLSGKYIARSLVFSDAIEYLESRGIGAEVIAREAIGGCMRGKYAYRVIVPVLDEDQNWLWYVARAWVATARLRYLYPAGSRGGTLYRGWAVKTPTMTPLLLVEGVFDALAHWPHASAFLGKPTAGQLDWISREAQRPLVVVLDGDAWETGWASCMRLKILGVEAGCVRLPPKSDPAEIQAPDLLEAARYSLSRDGECVNFS